MIDSIQDKEFIVASPKSSGRRIRLSDPFRGDDPEFSSWAVEIWRGQRCVVLRGDHNILCRLTWYDGKLMGRDVRGGVTVLTPVEEKSPVEEVRAALTSRAAANQIPPRPDNKDLKHLPFESQGYPVVSSIMDRFEKTSDAAVVLVGCNRPKYMQRVVDALKSNKTLGNYDVYMFLDKPPSDREDNLREMQASMGFDRVVRTPFNFGCGQHLIEARRQIFDRKQYDRAFIFEDDMTPSSTYLSFCERLLKWGTTNYSNVGAVQGWSKCLMPPDVKKGKFREIHATYTNWWGYLTTKWAWEQVRDFLYVYRDSFLQGAYKVRPTVPILNYFRNAAERNFHLRDGGFQPDPVSLTHRRKLFDSPPSGQDGATWLAYDLANLVRLAPTVNRGLYIGESGIHSTEEIFRKDRFDRMTLDEFEIDPKIRKFEIR